MSRYIKTVQNFKTLKQTTWQLGFTLVELIVVLVILAVLAAIAYVAYAALTKDAATKALMTTAQSLDREAIGLAAFDQVSPSSVVQVVLGSSPTVFTSTSDTTWTTANGATITFREADGTYLFTGPNGQGSNVIYYPSPSTGSSPGTVCPTSDDAVCSDGQTLPAPPPPPVEPVSGQVLSWGSNSSGQLGDGTFTDSSVPVVAVGALDGRTAVSVDSGNAHACAVLDDNSGVCWGLDSNQQLGNSSSGATHPPVVVNAFEAGTLLPNLGIEELTTGHWHTCARSTRDEVGNQVVACVGNNSFGQIGAGSTSSQFGLFKEVLGVPSWMGKPDVSAGAFHSCLVNEFGGAVCWGKNDYGQLGDGSTVNKYSPAGTTTDPWAPQQFFVNMPEGVSVAKISAGVSHTCALSGDGKAYCWGRNHVGQLGNGTYTDSTVPVAVNASGVLAGKTLVSIVTSPDSTCALDDQGAVYCWGRNTTGQLGDGSTVSKSSPVAVDTTGVLAGKTVTAIDTDGLDQSGKGHTCALTSDGIVACWGDNSKGQLGDGTTNASSVPVAVDTSGALQGKTVSAVTTGSQSTTVVASG